MKFEEVIDKGLDIFFSKDKTRLYVVLIFILGFVLRLIAGRNLGISADDANHAIRPIGISSTGKMVIWDQSSAIWYYVEGFFYDIFGTSHLSARFATALFGSFFIILIFIFTSYVFKSKKTGLISAFLIAISPFHIKNTLTELDVGAVFFIIFSAYFLFRFLREEKKDYLILSAVLIGLGVLVKVYALFFVVSFSAFLFYKLYLKEDKEKYKKIGVFLAIIFIFTIPTLTHNYLLYQDKGHMDLIFTNFFKLGVEKAQKIYGWGAGWMPYTDYKGFFFGHQKNFGDTAIPGFMIVAGFLFYEDPLLFILGILGLFSLFLSKKKEYLIFFILSFFPAFIYLGSNIPMAKHFVFGIALLTPPAGYFLNQIHIKIKKKKIRLGYIFLIVIIFNLIYLGKGWGASHGHFYYESAEGKLIRYKEEIPENALVLVDSRIYRGFAVWMLHDKNFLEATYFSSLMQQSNQMGGQTPIDIYYVECAADDCGWGTIRKSGQEINQTMENFTMQFVQIGEERFSAYGLSESDSYFPFTKPDEKIKYRVYKATLNLNPGALEAVKTTHNWYMYPLGYDENIGEVFDKYDAKGLGYLLDMAAHFVYHASLIGIFVSIAFLIYLFLIGE